MELSHSDRAQVLVEALPYIQCYNKKTVVVKYGGNAMISEELRKAVISDIILLKLVGINVVVIHGGGPEISAMLKKVGKESRFVNGLRYTDEETMDVVQMVLCGKVNKDLVATLNRCGGSAVGLCGLDGGMLKAVLPVPRNNRRQQAFTLTGTLLTGLGSDSASLSVLMQATQGSTVSVYLAGSKGEVSLANVTFGADAQTVSLSLSNVNWNKVGDVQCLRFVAVGSQTEVTVGIGRVLVYGK